ncbi:MAG TPA: tetratricopeptide repeat protein [Spirochaetota bacterium]|nr:tetratricopeptide repeat protein [Spirochaetota bacterium]HPJ43412.1 tetratricopeptide repeat protein [Spirochaetota bacterium]HPR37761.1 tetratricopeptide repeat protein [Spirochaetota bacterium]HRX47916.1 tetratricopeptide repeat protein [Spirochaetota bacterium]
MADKRTVKNIEIERSGIELFLMTVKDFIKNNRRHVKFISFGLLAVIIVSISLFIFAESSSSSSLKKYETIIDTYRMNPGDRSVKDRTINDLRDFIKNTRFGHAHQMSFYILGNLLYEDSKFAEAYDMFKTFIDKSSSDEIFIPIAVNKASVCLEEQGKTDEALALLLQFEDGDEDSIMLDQILYNTGRLYAVKGDRAKSREYYTKVMKNYPDSVFSERAKERLFLQGAAK